MGKRSDDNQDYEEYKVKVPKYDKAGNDITGDKLGKGGRYRKNGTFSAMAYDFQPLEESDEEKSRECLERELEMLAQKEKMAEIQEKQSTFDTINNVINTINSGLIFLADHPEIIEWGARVGKKVESGVIKSKDKFIAFIHKGKGKSQSIEISSVSVGQIVKHTGENRIIDANIEECSADIDLTSNNQKKENMSIEKARELIIGILADYINMKKDYISMKEKIDRLSNANVNNIELPKLDVNQVIAEMNLFIKKYPALMDDSTSVSVLTLLKLNTDEAENRKIKEVLKINVSSSLEDNSRE